MLRITPNGYQLVIIDFGAAEAYSIYIRITDRKAKNKIIHSEGPRGTPLFTSINSDRQGDIFFSDDLAAISYIICKVLLGFLPWEECKSCEEILQMKCSTVLEDSLRDYPELLQFVTVFKDTKTDNINYDDWINLFASKAASLAPKGTNIQFIPVQDHSVIRTLPSSSQHKQITEEDDQCGHEEKRRKVGSRQGQTSHSVSTKSTKSTKSTNSTSSTNSRKRTRRNYSSKLPLEIVDLCGSSSSDEEFVISKQPPRPGKRTYKRR